jgi:tetratricopeptide (TPR) repeat protein
MAKETPTVLTGDVGTSKYYRQLAMAKLEMGNRDKAQTAAERAVELDSSDPKNHSSLGEVHSILGQYEEAIKAYSTAAELAHTKAEKAFRESMGLADDDAKKMKEAALELVRMEAEYHNELGTAFTELKNFEKAEESCKEAIRLSPNCAHYHSSLGFIYGMQGKHSEEVELYKKAVELESSPYHKIIYEETLAMASEAAMASDILQNMKEVNSPETSEKDYTDGANMDALNEAIANLSSLVDQLDPYSAARAAGPAGGGGKGGASGGRSR